MRYALIQVPGIVALSLALFLLNRWNVISVWLALGILLAWVVKDVALFPFVWRSYDKDNRDDTHPIIGSSGIAEGRLTPDGYVRIKGELWRAETMSGARAIDPGEDVLVRGMRGMTLLVEPLGQKKG